LVIGFKGRQMIHERIDRPYPANLDLEKKLFTKASRRGGKDTKKKVKFRAFKISCFRDENIYS